MKKILLILAISLLNLSIIFGQGSPSDTTNIAKKKEASFLKKGIVPLSLITLGTALTCSQFEKDIQADIRRGTGNEFDLPIDDYIQYIPIVEMYVADALGVEAKSHWFDQTKSLLFSNALTGAVVHTLKRTINKRRPSGGRHAFPSGHTSLAFTNAAVLHQEFKDTSPVLAYSGFLPAATTGVFRVLNNKHWVSDVLAGAGIAILSTQIIYRIEPLKNFNPFKKTKNMALVPQVGRDNYGLYWAYQF